MRCLLNGCFLVGCVLLSLIGCGGESSDVPPPDFSPKRPSLVTVGAPIGDQRAYVKGVRHFGVDLYRQLSDTTGNVAFSPYGLHTSIAVLSHGMERAARDRVREVLGVDLPEVRIEGAAAGVLHRVFADSDTLNYFHMGTALWLQDGLTFKEKYLRRIVDFYAEQLYASDFAGDADQVVADINEWAMQQSSGWIKELVSDDHVDEDTKLASTHVVTVKGDWHFAFDRLATRGAPFQLADGKSVNVPTMHVAAKLAHAESAHWQVVYLPYRKGKFGMYILVPKQRGGLASATETIDGKELSLLFDLLKPKPVSLTLPRFAFTSQLTLTEPLKAMKMSDLFDSTGAAFTEIVEQGDVPISAATVTSTVRIEVKEAGEKDVAPMALDAKGGEVASQVVGVNCNQPFLFFVQHRSTGAIVIMGRVSDPRSE